ncbi:MAG: DUF5682 family protein [Roseiarcus sp.]
MDARAHIFGIRHHGPGSAASLIAALDALDPAMVLIEGPAECEAIAIHAAAPGMRPPVAMLLYARDAPELASFFPLAVFSPEWQAMRWALARGRPLRFIDLPAEISFALRRAERDTAGASGARAPTDGDDDPGAVDRGGLTADPLDRLASLAGHSDGESWWNALVEARGAAAPVFAAIESAMTALRAAVEGEQPATLHERRREAQMRLGIRDALKQTDGELAVVVGAWHVPALRAGASQAEDRALLKGLPRLEVAATWAPSTQPRLAAASGYGAGVTAPGWYEHLWGLYRDNARGGGARVAFAAGWQAKVANLLRGQGRSAPSASVIEASRLAITLASVRGCAMPGLDEMRDASLAALCEGDELVFRLVETRLMIGDGVGELDENAPQTPLAADLARWQKRLRLKPEALESEAALDLRSEAGLAKSTLLHRLLLIDVPWGRLSHASGARGTFREIWTLVWLPEFSVRLAEALVHGVTVERAAAGAARAQAARAPAVGALAELVKACLLADLPDAAEHCIARLQAAAVQAADVVALMEAAPPLVSILRYGTARPLPEAALRELVRALAGEIAAGARLGAHGLDDAAAARMARALAGHDEAVGLFEDAAVLEAWTAALRALAADSAAAPLARGLALRRLYDRGALGAETLAVAFARALSSGEAPAVSGRWLEGFLGADAEVLLHDEVLQRLVDGWITGLGESQFVESLPLLRRAFAHFGAPQRQRLLERVLAGAGVAARRSAPATEDQAPGFAAALPLLLTMLGLPDAPEAA